MNTHTKVSLSALGLGLTVLIGIGVVNITFASVTAELVTDATVDEVYFAQKVLRIKDKKLARIAPMQTDTMIGESMDNAFSRTIFYRELNNGKLQQLGQVDVADHGKQGRPSIIRVTRGQKMEHIALFFFNPAGDWAVTSLWGREDRVLAVPASVNFDTNNMRANAMLFGALDVIERADAIGRKTNKFLVKSYDDEDDITFSINPVGVYAVMTWKTYNFVNGVLQ